MPIPGTVVFPHLQTSPAMDPALGPVFQFWKTPRERWGLVQGVVVPLTGIMEGQDDGKIICYLSPSAAKDTLDMIPSHGLWGLNMSLVINSSKS